MLCDNCGKYEAEVFIKQVKDDETSDLNLCRQCAEKMGFISQIMPSITISFSIGDIIPKQKKIRKSPPKKREQSFDGICCSTCKMDFAEFRESGLLGCPDCYEAFRIPLGIFLQNIQGAESHWVASDNFGDIGVVSSDMDVPANPPGRNKERDIDIAKLKLEMNEAISREDYERAAQLRDMLAPFAGGAGEKND